LGIEVNAVRVLTKHTLGYIIRAEGEKQMDEYGVQWTEVNWREQIVNKQKFFATEEARKKFCDYLEEKDSFVDWVAWTHPVMYEGERR